jgi:hypothetical protein
MTDKPFSNRQQLEEIRRLLAGAPVIRAACDLDLLVFLHRHPRTLLTNEQLAAFLGYDMKQVAKAIDAFIDAGFLERTQNPNHPARMYLLALKGPQGGGLNGLLQLASTRTGRRGILDLLVPGQPQTEPVDISKNKAMPRLHAIG